jgi:co-chaperonin GroES (HSP10)
MIQPYGRRILYTPHSQESTLDSTDRRLTETGTVIAVGPDVKTVKVGDNIILNVYGTNTPEVNGQTVFFAIEDDEVILGTYETE